MKELSLAEENYLKAIFRLEQQSETVSTRAIAQELDAKDSSVTDMLKKLGRKALINYVKYHGVTLTEEGKRCALTIIRRHRLWEVFLVDKLHFSWDKIHPIAEQLEHIQSAELLDRLDNFLGNPRVDPHGDPIPDKHGEMIIRAQMPLAQADPQIDLRVIRVRDDSAEFLKYLDTIRLGIGDIVKVIDQIAYDESLMLLLEGERHVHVSKKVSENILVAEV